MGEVFIISASSESQPIAFYSHGVVFDKPPPRDISHQEGVIEEDPSSWGAYAIGYYGDGAIYRHPPWFGASPIGYYKDGAIFEDVNELNTTPIGFYKDGAIWKDAPTQNVSPVGYYNGANDGAAAAALILQLVKARSS